MKQRAPKTIEKTRQQGRRPAEKPTQCIQNTPTGEGTAWNLKDTKEEDLEVITNKPVKSEFQTSSEEKE